MKRRESESSILLEKIREQVSLAEDLISLIPNSALEWRPAIQTDSSLDEGRSLAGSPTPGKSTQDACAPRSDNELLRMGDLLGHLLDCMAGFCALLYSINSAQLGHFNKLRGLEVNHFCGVEEARARMRDYLLHIEDGFALLDDAGLGKPLPTVFVPEGEPILTLLLGNLEHLINHKHQLFMYLRLLGARVGTRDLYRIRGGQAGS